jgi:hypothetical protein
MNNTRFWAFLCSRLVHDFPGFTPPGNRGKERVKIGHGTVQKIMIARRVPPPELLFQVLPFIEELAPCAGNASGGPLPVNLGSVERITPP